MKHRHLITLYLLLLLPTALFAQEKPPNIIFIMADDVGAECLRSYGGESYATPELDKLAESGMRFTQAYTAPLCTPTRVQVLTGQYPYRNGWSGGIWTFPKEKQFVNPSIFNFGRMLKEAGYATAIAGKWQLARFENHPDHLTKLGFDAHCLWTWTYESSVPDGVGFEGKNKPARFWHPGIWQNGEILPDVAGKYGPDIYTDFLLEFMEQHREGPFLLYYPMALSHFPFVRVPGKAEGKSKQENFKDMVEYMDALVGKFVQKTEELGIAENTVIIFTGDNGTDKEMSSVIDGQRLQGGKGSLTDAGTRVPLLVKWSGVVEAGSTSNALVDLTDMLPTFAEVAQANIPNSHTVDGKSIFPLLTGKKQTVRDWVFCQVDDRWFFRTENHRLHHDGSFYHLPEHYSPEKIDPKKDKAAKKVHRRLVKAAKTEGLLE